MANWQEIKANLTQAKDTVVEKTDLYTNIASLYIKIKAAESKLANAYEKLGRIAYKRFAEEHTEEEKQEILKEIMTSVKAINLLKAEKARLEAAAKELSDRA